MNASQPTYLDSLYLMDQLQDYASPRSKLTTMIQSGNLLRIRRGLYVPGHQTQSAGFRPNRVAEESAVFASFSLKTLANKIYGPSYISFEFALSFYGLIPERVATVTSAVYNKNKDKLFETPVGTFLYRYTHPLPYHWEVRRQQDGGAPYLIASPEKAVCDTVSKFKSVADIAALRERLVDDMRIDMSELASLDINIIRRLAGLYKQKHIDWLVDIIKESRYA